MVSRAVLLHDVDTALGINSVPDYCPNGLQVAGKSDIKKIVTGVTACQALLEAALLEQADAILVHHGYFWKHENPCIVGIKRERLRFLLEHDLNLLAYHLPLDIHHEWGNNTQLAARLSIEIEERISVDGVRDLLCIGSLPTAQSSAEMTEHVQQALGRIPLVIEAGDHTIKKVAWCTGAAQRYITQAAECGADAYISGEISESTVHSAREMGIHYIAAGHHATERYGVQALGEYIAKKFGLDHQFIDIDNPV